MSEFNLLQFMGVDDTVRPKSRQELEAEERRRRIAFDEFQLQAHRAQEERQRQRAEMHLTGRACRTMNQSRDHRHHFGNFWFAQGVVADSHTEVGKPKAPPKEIKRPDRIAEGAVPPGGADVSSLLSPAANGQSGTPFRHDRLFQSSPLPPEPPKPRLVLRPREAPPQVGSDGTIVAAPPGPRGDGAVWTPASATRGGDRSLGHQTSADTRFTSSPPQANPFDSSSGGSPTVAQQRCRTPPARTTPLHASHRTTRAPFAEHYDANMLYDVPVAFSDLPRARAEEALQLDRDGIPRGATGIDFEEGQAREAQRLAVQMRRNAALACKRQRQQELRAQLDELTAIRRRRKQEEREIDDRTVYGYSLPLPQTAEAQKLRRRAARAELEAAWAEQAEEARARKAAEEAYYAPQPDDWSAVNRIIDTSEHAAAHQAGQKPAGAQQQWLRAWQEHQQTEGALRKAAAEEEIRKEMGSIGPEVLEYSNRILATEQQRRAAQEAYRAQLDAQVKQRQYDRRSLLADNYRRDARYHRPPFS